jgi:MFS family permease
MNVEYTLEHKLMLHVIRIGRKLAIFVTGIFFFLGSVLMTFSESYQAMLVGRFLAGIAVGSSGPCVSVYISEIARSEHRGALVTVYEVMLCFGCVVSVAVSGFLRHSEVQYVVISCTVLLAKHLTLIIFCQ